MSDLIYKSDDRAIEYEALITEAQAICIEVEGMKWENEISKQKKDFIAYDGESFQRQAELLWQLAQKMRNLK